MPSIDQETAFQCNHLQNYLGATAGYRKDTRSSTRIPKVCFKEQTGVCNGQGDSVGHAKSGTDSAGRRLRYLFSFLRRLKVNLGILKWDLPVAEQTYLLWAPYCGFYIHLYI